ncbi:MAG: hypothetical protein KGO94_13195, partial [Alphaproteobacteria bacterium]|nr:hypothetical protein [Alphaproteobacteria bacterium]
VLGLSLSTQQQHIAVVINGGDKPSAMLLPARLGYGWVQIFSSAGRDEIAPHSVCLFEEKPCDVLDPA